jgi:hypothetical protein
MDTSEHGSVKSPHVVERCHSQRRADCALIHGHRRRSVPYSGLRWLYLGGDLEPKHLPQTPSDVDTAGCTGFSDPGARELLAMNNEARVGLIEWLSRGMRQSS